MTSRLRKIATEHLDSSVIKQDPRTGHAPLPGLTSTHHKELEPLVKPSPLPHEPPKPFKLK